jgi:acetyl-CoA/propionyl-CoA carboxylase biotin carboxyl carrier protein
MENKEWLKELAFDKPPPAGDEEEEEPKVERSYAVEVSGKRFDVKVIGAGFTPNGAAATPAKAPKRKERSKSAGGAPGELVSPIQGTVLKVEVEKGASVDEGALICVIEAMKMENEITAPASGTIEELNVSVGGAVSTGDTIAVIK